MNRAATLCAALVSAACAQATVVTLEVTGTVASNSISVGELAGAAPGQAVTLIMDIDPTPLGLNCCGNPAIFPIECCGLAELYDIDDATFEITVGEVTLSSNFEDASKLFYSAGWIAGQDTIDTNLTRIGIDAYGHNFHVIDFDQNALPSVDIRLIPDFIPASKFQDGGTRDITGQTFPIWEITYNNFGTTEVLLINFDGGITRLDDCDACPCEFDSDPDDSEVTILDLLSYLSFWLNDDTRADIDDATGVTVTDLLTFLACWFPASNGGACP